eukprot:TRINITY_DN17335_c0_g1_i1.p1 TRINITY_DN17335_c0_g1~~TRINITY_DN17335_c0_g1_i1.p1  ORF type:complete len:2018 (+),score=786.56 TRINITY_DN17335_c0_g1_i1:63-6056(+)
MQAEEKTLSSKEVRDIVAEDAGFDEHRAALLRVCVLDKVGCPSRAVVAQQLLYLQWIVSPENFTDDELRARPKHMRFVQECLAKGAVKNIGNHLTELLSHMVKNASVTGIDSAEDAIHAAAALVGLSQRFQLDAQEFTILFNALHVCMKVLEGHSMNLVGGYGGGWAQASAAGGTSTIAGAAITQQLRFPAGTAGALIEDAAYLVSLAIINALRVPQPGTLALWSRDDPGKTNEKNALLSDANLVNLLRQFCCRSEATAAPHSYVVDKIEQVGHGDRRSREEAAGYYAIVLVGVSAFLMSHGDADTRRIGGLALQMCCGTMAQLGVGSRVIARCSWQGGLFARGVVRSIRDDDMLVIRFDEGEEEAVQRAHVKLESTQQLNGRGWHRLRAWFPSYHAGGMGTVISQDVLMQSVADVLDCWLAATMIALVDELIPAEQEEFRVWEEAVRQRDTPVSSSMGAAYPYPPSAYQPAMHPPSIPQAADLPVPECPILVDCLRAIAFVTGAQCAPGLQQDAMPSAWRVAMASDILAYNKADARVAAPRPGAAMFTRFVRKAHGAQGPLAWVVEASPGRQGETCRTALLILDAYVEMCTALCINDEATQTVFLMMQADSEPRSTFHISLRYTITDASSVMNAFISGASKLTPEYESFLSTAVGLISTFVTTSTRVREIITQQAELHNACFAKLFSLLEKPVGGRVIGKVFTALAGWCLTHADAVQMWLRVSRGGVLSFGGQVAPPPSEYPTPGADMYGGLHQPGVNSFDPTRGGAPGAPPAGGMDYELVQEKRNRLYPQTLGFLTLLLRLLDTVNWRTAAQQEVGPAVYELAVLYVKWTLENVLLRWDEQRYDNMWERWQMAALSLRIVRSALQVPEVGAYDVASARQRPHSAMWASVNQPELLTKILQMTMERRERDRRTGAVMDEILAECLATITGVLACSPTSRGDAPRHGGRKSIAQDIVDWDDGELVMKLSCDEWHSITLNAPNPQLISHLCITILLQLARERCRLSHHFIAPGRGRPEDITRDAETSLLLTAKSIHQQLLQQNAAQYGDMAGNLDKHVIRPLEAGRRVGSVAEEIKRYLIAPMEGAGLQQDVLELRLTIQGFEDNKAEKVQEVLAGILHADAPDEVESRRVLLCDLLYTTLTTGGAYYNLAHILCGVPERYVEARVRGTSSMPEEAVLRPFGIQRHTCLSVLVSRLSEPDFHFVRNNPIAATHFLRLLATLASDRVVGRAVLRYLRSINLIEKLMSLLRERLSELPVHGRSAVPDPAHIAREFSTCASILQLASLELFTNQDAPAQSHFLKMLVTSRESHHPLLLEAIRSLDLDSLPIPQPVPELLNVQVPLVYTNGVPQYSLEALEHQLAGAAGAHEAVALAAQANATLNVYPCVVDYVEKWCRLADVALVTIEAEATTVNDRASTGEVDEVLFQTLLSLINQMSSDVGRGRGASQAEHHDTPLVKQRVKLDTRLSRTALALVDTIYNRASRGSSNRSAEQLGHLLRPLLQCLCAAEDRELRTNLYTVLIAFLYNVDESPSVTDPSGHQADKMQVRRACQDELLRNPHALLHRLFLDVSAVDQGGALTTAAWTTLAKVVEWDQDEKITPELHGSNEISQHLAQYDAVLVEIIRRSSQGDTTGSQYLGGYQAFMSFLLAYASTPRGAKALAEHHLVLQSMRAHRTLGLCGDYFSGTSELLQERCAQIALPMLRVICAVVKNLATDHSVMQEVQLLLSQHSRLFDFIFRRPFNVCNASSDAIDLPSLHLLECATQLLATYAGSNAPCAQDAPRLVQQHHLRNVLIEFSSRSAWMNRIVCDPAYVDGYDGKEEADTVASGVVLNVLQCMRAVSDINFAAGEPPGLFDLSMNDPDGLSSDSILSKNDLTVLLCCLKDFFQTATHLLKARPTTTSQAALAADPDALLMVTHHSIAEALLLLFHHLRGVREARFRTQAEQHVPLILRDTTDYVHTFSARSQQDEVINEVMSSITALVKAIAEVLGVTVSKVAY